MTTKLKNKAHTQRMDEIVTNKKQENPISS